MNMKRITWLLGLLMGLAAACKGKDNTLIVVEVSSDLDVPSQMDAVRIDVTGPTAKDSKLYALTSPVQLPARLALVPQDADDASLTVRATGLRAGVEVAWQAARVTFVPGESKLLTLTLASQCAYAGCGPTQSCAAGVCVSVPVIPGLPDYTPETNPPATGGGGGAGGVFIPGSGIPPLGGTGGTSSTPITVGGTVSTAGSSGMGGVCAAGPVCGGDLVGAWEVSSSCLRYDGYADVSYLGLTCVPNVAKITGSVSVTGRLTLNANGKYTDNTITTGSEVWELDRSCLILSGTRVTCNGIGSAFSGALSTFGYQEFQCTDSATGGCTCLGTINQTGGMGVLYNDINPTGSYKVAGNTLTRADLLSYSYCVSGSRMTATPIPIMGTPYAGTVVLQKTCTGSGCTGGVGGNPGTGGSSGGSVSTGGSKSTGGSSSSSAGSCPSVAACGGDLVGTWNVTSSCLKLDGEFLTRGTGMGCDRAKVTGSLQVKGSFVATVDKTFQDKTTTTGSVTVALDRQCLFMSGTWTQCDLISVAVEGLGFRNVRCTTAIDGGCTCPAIIDHPGNMGLIVAEPETYGTYTTSGTTFMTGENPLTGAPLEYSYCAGSGVLIASPKTSSPPTKGTIEFQKFSGTGGTGGSTGMGGTGGSTSTALPALPCEVVAQDGGGAKCVTAHSTVRTIVPGYSGPLYQLCKGSVSPGPGSCKGTTQEIFAKDGCADVDLHESFCGSEACTITKIYDQSGQKNDLEPAPKGGAKGTPDNPAKASAIPVRINGHTAYGILIKAGMGYRTGCNGCTIKKTNGMPLNDEPQTVYMVTSQKDLIDGCCFDYGNAETTSNDDGNGAAEAVYFGAGVVWGTGYGGKPGPWVMADLENGVYAGWENKQDKLISTNKPLKFDYVTAVLVGDTADKNNGKGRFALYGADAQGLDASLGKLTCMYDGIRPEKNGYVPMQKQGSLILGTGSDNSSGGGGRFYEGATIAGPALSNATLSRLHDAIVAAKYENAN